MFASLVINKQHPQTQLHNYQNLLQTCTAELPETNRYTLTSETHKRTLSDIQMNY